MPQEDYLKLTLENILNQLSEVKDMINDSTKVNSDFRDQINTKIQLLENRVNALETEKNLVKGIFSSAIVQKVLGWIAAGGYTFIAYNGSWYIV